MPIEPTKNIFGVPVIKREENPSQKKRPKPLKKQEKESGKVDIRV